MTESRKKIRIIAIINSLNVGGAEKQTLQLLNNLDKNKFEITLVSLKGDDSTGQQISRQFPDNFILCSVKKRLDISCAKKLANYIDEWQGDIVLCTNLYPMTYALLANIFASRKLKLVEVIHTTEVNKFYDKAQIVFYKYLMRWFDKIIFVSEIQSQYWLNNRKLRVKNIATIHNGVDIEHYSKFNLADTHKVRGNFNFKTSDYVLGVCAVFRPEKRHIDIIESFSVVRKKGVDARLLLIGDGPERQAIENKITELEMKDSVKITGFKSDVRPYISACDCMMMASVAVETFSIAVLEAMAMRKPVISSIVGGAQEQIEDGITGLLFKKGDIGALSDCIVQLQDADLRSSMGEAAFLKVSSEFTTQHMVSKYEAAFEELCKMSVAK